ncbi:MAG: MBL fold metallo-hydrolase [Butyricicoccus sp.]
MNIHAIRLDFEVTEQVKRYVYVYLLEGKQSCWLIDSGVAGGEEAIVKRVQSLGKSLSDIKGIFLTHAHPDHIGTAAWFREHTGCKLYASEGEHRWIEQIELQFQERPIPNFYKLAGRSVPVDEIVRDGDTICLEGSEQLCVIGTPGHSMDDVSYRLGQALFLGDCVPREGDIPIYVDSDASKATLRRLAALRGVRTAYSAWDTPYSAAELQENIQGAIERIDWMDTAVRNAVRMQKEQNLNRITEEVCRALGKPQWAGNPLFVRTVQSHIQACGSMV